MYKIYGYVRVSSKDQNFDRQIIALEEYKIPLKNIFYDKLTGSNFTRPGYKKLIKKLRRGDLLIIHSIDRLGRNYEEILEQWNQITKIIGADINVIDMPLLDTRNNQNGLTGQFISDLVLQILSYVAEIEREKIHQRQLEGIKAAKDKGIKFGRPKKEIDITGFKKIVNEWRKNEKTCEEAINSLGLSRSSFFRRIKEYNL